MFFCDNADDFTVYLDRRNHRDLEGNMIKKSWTEEELLENERMMREEQVPLEEEEGKTKRIPLVFWVVVFHIIFVVSLVKLIKFFGG